jgi:hypothetical protein
MRRMKGWLTKAWHDPVGSKVIAGVILGGPGAVWLWSTSNFSRNLTTAWTGATSALAVAWHWFLAPTVPPSFVVLLILSMVAVAFAYLRQLRRIADAERFRVERESESAMLRARDLSIRNSELSERLSVTDAARKQAVAGIDEVSERLADADHTRSQAESDLAATVAQLVKSEDALAKIEADYSALNERLSVTDASFQRARATADDAERARKQAESELAPVRSRLAKSEETLAISLTHQSALQERLAESEALQKRAVAEIKEISREHAIAGRARTQAEFELANVRKELANVEKERAKATPPVGSPDELDEAAIRVLKHLYDKYPGYVEIHWLVHELAIKYPVVEQRVEVLMRMSLVQLIRSKDGSTDGHKLTVKGRNLCLAKGL